MTRQISTLHFDLSDYSPDLEFRLLSGVKGGTVVKRYMDAPSKMDEHRSANKALGLVPEAHLHRITHYLEDVDLPARGTCLRQIVYPSLDDHPLPEIAMLFFHIPDYEVMQALHRIPAYAKKKPHHLAMSTYGVAAERTFANFAAVHQHAAHIKPPGVT
ncbi:MAG: hypothetical protein U9P00_13875, partial [Pseudomonadota bacterium]|nr:hypothetical protein [Pseudomonadota bacterium]